LVSGRCRVGVDGASTLRLANYDISCGQIRERRVRDDRVFDAVERDLGRCCAWAPCPFAVPRMDPGKVDKDVDEAGKRQEQEAPRHRSAASARQSQDPSGLDQRHNGSMRPVMPVPERIASARAIRYRHVADDQTATSEFIEAAFSC
jgi:hypothetical protein